jgi:membrane protein
MKLSAIPKSIRIFWNFITEDIWLIMSSEVTGKSRRAGYHTIKVITLAVKRYQVDNLQARASALTYSTFLSIIPLLAVLLSIAKGFGFQNIIEIQLFEYFPGQKEIVTKILTFVNSYMQHSHDGVFLGIGLILLFYTVFNLISNIENTFNLIWQIPKGRSYARRFTDYFSVFFILPIFVVCSSGLSILFTTTISTLKNNQLLAPVYEILMTVGPVIVTVFIFTILYMYMPNTKVKFKHAFSGGFFAAIGFHLFQYLYISGQMWVSKYNAIYGSFAFLPLLLLWMQLSWVICLVGAEITYSGQNVQNFEFETDSKNISRRYLDFLLLTIVKLIVKRFEQGKVPYTATEISVQYKIPIHLTNRLLYQLVDVGIIKEFKDDDSYPNYQPAVDINQITLAYLFAKIDRQGSENFKIDNKHLFHPEWKAILQSREDMFLTNKDVLIKDL